MLYDKSILLHSVLLHTVREIDLQYSLPFMYLQPSCIQGSLNIQDREKGKSVFIEYQPISQEYDKSAYLYWLSYLYSVYEFYIVRCVSCD